MQGEIEAVALIEQRSQQCINEQNDAKQLQRFLQACDGAIPDAMQADQAGSHGETADHFHAYGTTDVNGSGSQQP